MTAKSQGSSQTKRILDLPGIARTYLTLVARMQERLVAVAPLPLRLIVGYGFAEHGIAKLARGLDAFPTLLQALGVPLPKLFGLMTMFVEIGGGLAVLAGAFIPLVSVPMIIVLLVAVFTVHFQYGFSSIKLQAVTPSGAQFGPPGYETDLLYMACIAAIVVGGSGPLSLDGWLAHRCRRRSVSEVKGGAK